MNIQGMPPRFAYTNSNYGLKFQDYIQLRNEYKNKCNAKFTLPKKEHVVRSDGKVKTHDSKNDSPSDVWNELKEKYDIRNASFDELCEISTSLYKANEITLFEHAMFTFDPSKSPMTSNVDICLTSVDSNGRRDWISEYEARAAQDLRMGNMQSYKHMQKALDILRKLT